MSDHVAAGHDTRTERSSWESVSSKTRQIISFVIPLITSHYRFSDVPHTNDASIPPFFLGLNGIQGAGKTTLVRHLAETLRCPPYNFPTVVLSIDDLYLPRIEQRALASKYPTNSLIQHRGQPGTHDIKLGTKLFEDLKAGKKTKVPAYNKSAFDGEGDRVPEEEWETVNDPSKDDTLKVVIFEGWCVGFRPLEQSQVEAKWTAAVDAIREGTYQGRLGFNDLNSVEFINEKLKDYDLLTKPLQHRRTQLMADRDAVDTLWVYDWRLEQEVAMIKEKGSGMTADQVKLFVDGYYPAYELFYDKLRQGVFNRPGKQLKIVIGKDRETLKVGEI